MKLINQDVPVHLEAGEWLYLLGWITAHRSEGEPAWLTDIFASIAKQLES